ncbi:hypothetical protein DFH09DRAFT_1101475 [Mycena vulgaris]|nr:hypothetical protein DFH09DRAFT_1101475 [Mycena vulgaris]
MTSVVARGNREKKYLSIEGDKGMVVEGEEERWSNGVTKWGLIYAEIAGDITRSTFLHLVDEMAKPSLEHVVRGALLCPIFGGKAGMHYIIDCINEGIYLRVNNIDEFFLPHCPKRVPPNWSKVPSRLPGFVCTLPRSGTPLQYILEGAHLRGRWRWNNSTTRRSNRYQKLNVRGANQAVPTEPAPTWRR